MTNPGLPPEPRTSSLIVNAMSMQGLGQAFAIVFIDYMHRAHGIQYDESVEQAYTLIFTECLTAVSLLVHLLVCRFLLPRT